MNWHRHHTQHGGSAPATPGFTAVAPEWLIHPGAADAAPAIPAAESTLGSHPCVALYSAQVLPEWTTSTSPCHDFSSNGDNPLNFVSHYKGSLQGPPSSPTQHDALRVFLTQLRLFPSTSPTRFSSSVRKSRIRVPPPKHRTPH